MGLSALVLSLCGLFISIYETTLVREEQRASVWPYVQMGVSFDGRDVAFWAQNKGVGPARVRAAAVEHEGDVESPETLLDTLQREVLDGAVDLSACFCSVYDECWTTSMQDVLERMRGEGASRPTSRQVESCEGAESSGI